MSSLRPVGLCLDMADADPLEHAREAVRRAADAADGETREQLKSVEESLAEQMEPAAEEDDAADPKPDRLAELERKLSGLLGEKEDNPDAQDDIEDAVGALDAYRERVE